MAKKTAYYGISLSLAMVFSYLENLLALPIPIPGIKLGLANLAVVILLMQNDALSALTVNLARIILCALLFGNAQGMLLALSGGLLSLISMMLAKRSGIFSIYGISALGGSMHGVGQILTAMIIFESTALIFYLPFLMLSGIFTGIIIAFIAAKIIVRIPKWR